MIKTSIPIAFTLSCSLFLFPILTEAQTPKNETVQLQKEHDPSFKKGSLLNYQLENGKLISIKITDLKTQGHYTISSGIASYTNNYTSPLANTVIIYDRKLNETHISTELEGESIEIQDIEGKIHSTIKNSDDHLETDEIKANQESLYRSARALSPEKEIDPQGRKVIDIFIGYEPCAVAKLNTSIWVDALKLVETVNLSLQNSMVDDVVMRLVGASTFSSDSGLSISSSGQFNWTRERYSEMNLSGADFKAAIFCSGGGYAGLAFVPGSESINLVNSKAFKHEIGHNMGGSHCNTNNSDNYKFGYNTGTYKTNLCGNNVYYYSNPDVTLDGIVMGDARTANMARQWRERSSTASSYTTHAIPYEGEIELSVADDYKSFEIKIPKVQFDSGLFNINVSGDGQYYSSTEGTTNYDSSKTYLGDYVSLTTSFPDDRLKDVSEIEIQVKNANDQLIYVQNIVINIYAKSEILVDPNLSWYELKVPNIIANDSQVTIRGYKNGSYSFSKVGTSFYYTYVRRSGDYTYVKKPGNLVDGDHLKINFYKNNEKGMSIF